MEITDADAVLRTLSGDQEAFAVLVRRYSPALSAFAYDRLGRVADAQDAVQEALVTAYNRLPALRDETRFAAWAYEILRNICAQRLRRQGIEKRSLEHLANQRAGRGPLTPIEAVQEEERTKRLREAVERLSPVLREVVVLRYMGAVGRQEAAAILDITLAALDKRLERALRELRHALKDD